MAFSPDDRSLAVVLEYKGDWADDSLLISDAPLAARRDIFQAHGHITDVSWMSERRTSGLLRGRKGLSSDRGDDGLRGAFFRG